MRTAIGAMCEIEWKDEPGNVRYYYISFGKWVDDETKDTFGVPDTEIFFFCPGGEEELKGLVGDKSYEDFVVNSYEVQWKS